MSELYYYTVAFITLAHSVSYLDTEHIQDFLSIRTGGLLQMAEGKYKYIRPRLLRLGAAVTQERIPAKLDAAYHPKYDSTRNHIAADAYARKCM